MSGGDSEEVTPVPIPNTEVKLLSADGSWDTRPCESRTLPGFKYAGVAELADAPDLGSGAARRGGSTPFTRTINLICALSSAG